MKQGNVQSKNNEEYLYKLVRLAIDNPSNDFVKFNLYVSSDFRKKINQIRRYGRVTVRELVLSSYANNEIFCPFIDKQIIEIHRQIKMKGGDVKSVADELGFKQISPGALFNSNIQQLAGVFRWWLNNELVSFSRYQELNRELGELNQAVILLTNKICSPKFQYNKKSLLNRKIGMFAECIDGFDSAIAVRIPINVNEALDAYHRFRGEKYRKEMKRNFLSLKILQPINSQVDKTRYESICRQSEQLNKVVKKLNTDKLNQCFDSGSVNAMGYLLKGIKQELDKTNREVMNGNGKLGEK